MSMMRTWMPTTTSKHKVRLVVKGYAQWDNIDYDEVFAPVTRLDSVRLLIALTAHEG
jgi:hypothetical protein